MDAQAEREEQAKYVKEQVEYLAEHLNLQEGTGLYKMLEMTIRNTYFDAWARGSDYRSEQS